MRLNIFFPLLLSCFVSIAMATIFDGVVVDYYSLSRYSEEQVKPFEEVWRLSIVGGNSVFAQIEDGQELMGGDLFNYAVYKSSIIGELTYKGAVSDYLFYYNEPLPKMEWSMLDRDSVVCGYSCQEATVVFRGKKWKVWYTLDIPYSDGPWKLNGLPGLILKATDVEANYSFIAYCIKKRKMSVLTFSCKDAKKTTFEKFQHDYIWSYRDSYGFLQAVTGKTFHVIIDDKEWKPVPKNPCLLEYFDEK